MHSPVNLAESQWFGRSSALDEPRIIILLNDHDIKLMSKLGSLYA